MSSTNLSPAGYLADILNQPQAVRDTLDALARQTLPETIQAGLAQGRLRRIVLTGMGASFYAFHPLFLALVRRGVETYLLETSELLYATPALLRPDTLVIAASQSGLSAEIVSLVARKKIQDQQKSFPLLGVTNTPGSPLASAADACLLTSAGAESTVSCKTYLAALLAMSWLEPALFGLPAGPLLADLAPLVAVVENYLAGWRGHVDALKTLLKNAQDVFYVGRGSSLAAAGTAGLTTKESTHLPAEGMSSPAFRHGPFEMISPRTFVLVFEGTGQAAELNRRLYTDILAAGGMAGLVSENAPDPVFRLAAVPEPARPVVEILPVQMMTIALAELHGHVAGRFNLLGKVVTTE